MRILQRALTFEDVLMVPRKSSVLPKDVSLKSRLTKNISLNIPFIKRLWIRLQSIKPLLLWRHFGGIGIRYKNMDIQTQVKEITKVKKVRAG